MTTALWTPDIAPPHEWLLPAVLYQERIATFAPWPGLGGRDGQAYERLRDILGDDLYEPVRLGAALDADPDLVRVVRGNLALWRTQLARAHMPAMTAEWVVRSERGPERRDRMRRRVLKLDRAVDRASAAVRSAKEDVETRRRLLDEERNRLSVLREQNRPQHDADRQQRRTHLEPLTTQLDEVTAELQRLPRTDPRRADLDARREQLIGALKTAAAAQPKPRATNESIVIEAQEQIVVKCEAALADARSRLKDHKTELERLRRQLSAAEDRLDEPWICDRRDPRFRWLRADDAAADIPPDLDTLAAGKVRGALFEMLVEEGGFWVHRNSDSGMRSLIGPRPIVALLLETLGQWHALTREGWVAMSAATPAAPAGQQPDRDDLLCKAIQVVLPVPEMPLPAAVEFRRKHEEELRILRSALRLQVPEQAAHEDFLRHLEQTMSEPLEEIRLAVGGRRTPTAKHVRTTIVHGAARLGRETAVGVAAGAVAEPVFGPTISPGGVGAVVFGTVVLANTNALLRAANSRLEAHFARRRMPSHPFKYIYHLQRQALEHA